MDNNCAVLGGLHHMTLENHVERVKVVTLSQEESIGPVGLEVQPLVHNVFDQLLEQRHSFTVWEHERRKSFFDKAHEAETVKLRAVFALRGFFFKDVFYVYLVDDLLP